MLYPTRLAAATCKGGSIVVGRKHQGRAVCSLPRGRNGALRARWAGRARVRGHAMSCGGGNAYLLRVRTISAALASPSLRRTHALRSTSHSHVTRASSEPHTRTIAHAFLCTLSLFCCVLIRSDVLLLKYDKPISNSHQSRRTSTARSSACMDRQQPNEKALTPSTTE